MLTIFIQGCGGSSSSIPEKPVEPVEYSFSLTSQLINDCGISSAFTKVELLLQDDTWQTIASYKPDENGVISFVTTNEFINYTLVAENQQGNEAQGLNVVSFYQASSDTPAHYQAQFDDLIDNDTSCECVTQDLNLDHAPLETLASVTSSSHFDSWRVINSENTLFEGVQVCRTIDGDWPLHSFSVEGLAFNQKLIAAGNFLDLNVEANIEGVWSLFAKLHATPYGLTPPYQEVSSEQLIKGAKHFSTQVAEGEQSLLVFDNHIHTSENYYQSQASVTFELSGSIFGTAVSKTKHQVISTIAEVSLDVMAGQYKPAFNEPYFDEIKEDGSYDYSAISGYPMAIINFTFRATDPKTGLPMPAKWTFYGPEKGLLAISAPLTGYDDIIDIKTSKKSQDVQLIKSKMANNYSDYIKYYQANSALDRTNDFVKDMTAAELRLKFN